MTGDYVPPRPGGITPPGIQQSVGQSGLDAVHHRHIGMLVEIRRAGRQSVSGEQIVTVEQDEIVSAGPVDGAIARVVQTAIVLVEYRSHSAVLRGEFAGDL